MTKDGTAPSQKLQTEKYPDTLFFPKTLLSGIKLALFMPYHLNPEQYASVVKLDGSTRYAHFLGRIADWEQIWGVKNEDGWLFPVVEGQFTYFPVWPHPEYAEKITNAIFPGHEAAEISLEEFMDNWLPGMVDDEIKVGVFPNEEWDIWIMEPEDLLADLREEVAKYE